MSRTLDPKPSGLGLGLGFRGLGFRVKLETVDTQLIRPQPEGAEGPKHRGRVAEPRSGPRIAAFGFWGS